MKRRYFAQTIVKGSQSAFWTALTWTLIVEIEKNSPQPEIKVHLEFRFNLRSVLLDFQSFTEKPVFECNFCSSFKRLFL